MTELLVSDPELPHNTTSQSTIIAEYATIVPVEASCPEQVTTISDNNITPEQYEQESAASQEGILSRVEDHVRVQAAASEADRRIARRLFRIDGSAIADLYLNNSKGLFTSAYQLLKSPHDAEDVVMDSLISLHGRVIDGQQNLFSYAFRAVINGSYALLRHREVVNRLAPKPFPDAPSAEYDAIMRTERDAVVRAVHDLPARQREVIVLRYYADLSEAEIAKAMKISQGAVKSHASRAMAALESSLRWLVE